MISPNTKNKINRLIFSCLAKGDSVFIDGIGSLSTKTITVISKKTKKPTAKKIITLFKDCCAVDLKDLMLSLDEISQSNVEELFDQWVSVSKVNGENKDISEYDIDGVLNIKLDRTKDTATITPSQKLENYLNPLNGEANLDIKKKNSSSVKLFVACIVIAIVAVLLLMYIGIIPLNLADKGNSPAKTEQTKTPETIKEPQEIIVTEPIEVEDSIEIKETITTEKEQNQEITPTKGRYYIIIGSFSSEENAIELVMKLKSQGYNSNAMPSKNGRLIMVSIADFATEQEANAVMKNNNFNYDCWVYLNN